MDKNYDKPSIDVPINCLYGSCLHSIWMVKIWPLEFE